MKVSVIVPAYNEEKTIVQVLIAVKRQSFPGVNYEVIVVNDGSKDDTSQVLLSHPELYDRFVDLKENCGKGGAVQHGLRVATGDYVLFQDADLEYDPNDYAAIVRPAIDFNADIVFGSRFLAPSCIRIFTFNHFLGNKLLTLVFNILNNTTFSDIYSCYLLYRRELINPDELVTFGWQQQAEILSLIVRRGSRYYEVPVSYNGRTQSEGKKIRWYHAMSVIWTIAWVRLFRAKRKPTVKAPKPSPATHSAQSP